MTAGWNNVAVRFHALLRALTPSPTDRRMALAAAATVGDVIAAHHVGRDAGGRGSIVIGGIGKDTAVTPLTAVDVLCVLPVRLRPSASGIADSLEDLHNVLAGRFAEVTLDDAGRLRICVAALDRCIAVHLRCGFPFNGAGWLTPAMAPDGTTAWRHVNPEAEHRHLVRADQASAGKATHLVRLLKAWRRAHVVDISAFAMELLAAEFVRLWPYRRASLLFYDWMLRDALFWLSLQAGRTLPVPGTGETVDIGTHWQSAAEVARRTALHACALERGNDHAAAAAWRYLFGVNVGDGKAEPEKADMVSKAS